MRISGGTKNDFVGTKRVFGPHKRNLRGQNNNFWGTSDLEFERTKRILGGPNKDFKGTKQ